MTNFILFLIMVLLSASPIVIRLLAFKYASPDGWLIKRIQASDKYILDHIDQLKEMFKEDDYDAEEEDIRYQEWLESNGRV